MNYTIVDVLEGLSDGYTSTKLQLREAQGLVLETTDPRRLRVAQIKQENLTFLLSFYDVMSRAFESLRDLKGDFSAMTDKDFAVLITPWDDFYAAHKALGDPNPENKNIIDGLLSRHPSDLTSPAVVIAGKTRGTYQLESFLQNNQAAIAAEAARRGIKITRSFRDAGRPLSR